MTQVTRELIELAERVEKAEGADRELDCAIGVGLGLFQAIAAPEGSARGALFARVEPFGLSAPGNGSGDSLVPAYTASIDAAMSLVPEGGRWFKCGVNNPESSAAETRMFVCGPVDEDGRWHASGECLTDETPSGDSRALVSAALRARSAATL